jgi:DNA polymerase-3 subunit alpha (Gram-positive type)
MKPTEEDQLITLEVIYEFLARGFSFSKVDVFSSAASQFLVEGDMLRPPLISVHGMGEKVCESIVAERNVRAFTTVEDFAARTRASGTHIDLLRSLDALGGMPESAQLSFFD